MGLAVARSLAAGLGLGGVEQELPPPGGRQRGGIDPQRDGFLRMQARVIAGGAERTETVGGAGAVTDPG
ncbi:hypothetical protein [Streptomyces pinistramenti]|uniref:hypothetical protein n=1 Tax=Streptomyces pinistramenti TaxID=2884812 RepID=UPI001D069B4D|nr:hypothetical protein [Streptomyces pinistramenti]MCB5908062.1 hypothetical protein [Streptomyces pinistramenti]